MLKPFDRRLDIYRCDCGVILGWRITRENIEVYDPVNRMWIKKCPKCNLTTSYQNIEDGENSWDGEED